MSKIEMSRKEIIKFLEYKSTDSIYKIHMRNKQILAEHFYKKGKYIERPN